MEILSQQRSVREESVANALARVRMDPPPAPELEASPHSLLSQLATTIEYEIIPRLMLAHRGGTVPARLVGTAEPFTSDEVESFARLAMSQDEDAAMGVIEGMRVRRIPVEQIYVDLLAPAARHLGKLWTDDLCSFTDVTIGLGRLQCVLRELSPAMGPVASSKGGRRILLLPSPGEQHTFGLLMVGDFFRRTGWAVSGGGCALSRAAVLSWVGAEFFDVVGLSTGSEVHLAALASTIAAIRQQSCNPDVVVLVGGPLCAERPELVQAVAADGMTMDGRAAPALAERLVCRTSEAQQSHG